MPDHPTPRDGPELSAVAILRPAGGAALGAGAPITAGTVAASLPDPVAVAHAQEWFRSVGFDVSDPGAVDFSITGSLALFERVFGTTLAVQGDGQVLDATVAGGGRELPLAGVPDTVRSLLEAVAFTEPPAFGPGGDGP